MANIFILHGDDINGIDEAAAKLVQEQKDSGFADFNLTVLYGKGLSANDFSNAVLAALIGLFNIAHAFMELPSDNAGQYVIMPMMIIVGLVLAWYSIKYVKDL